MASVVKRTVTLFVLILPPGRDPLGKAQTGEAAQGSEGGIPLPLSTDKAGLAVANSTLSDKVRILPAGFSKKPVFNHR